MSEHEHNWVFGGVRYHHGDRLSGSGARERFLEDWFYCSSCLANRYTNKRTHGNSYADLPDGVSPKVMG